MGLYNYDSTEIPKSDRIPKLVENLYAKMPEIESARAILITESYRQTENEPMVIRRAKAFALWEAQQSHREDVRPIRNFLMNGWKQSLILWRQEVRIRSIFQKRQSRS